MFIYNFVDPICLTDSAVDLVRAAEDDALAAAIIGDLLRYRLIRSL